MKFDIIMPTYNDSDTIERSLLSIINQGYKNFILYIVDDGSTDNTKEIIKSFKKKHDKNNQIRYFYKENADQLNAIKYVINYLDGDYIYICHSDDILNDNVLEKANEYLLKHKEYDAIISNLDVIDENDNITGMIKIYDYKKNKRVIPEVILNLGRNLYSDFGFCKREIFVSKVYKNYLTWNGPFWLDIENNEILNIKKVDFNFFKYRVFSENYINNDLGKLCVINGELRVLCNLLSNYYIPFFRLQYFLFRVFNKLKLRNLFMPIYFSRKTNNNYKSKIINFTLKKRFTDKEIKNNLFLNSIKSFYENYNHRKINLDNIDEIIYIGSDLRIFNKKILDSSISKFYIDLLNEMSKGFDEVVIGNNISIDKVKELLRFLCINTEVKITRKD